MLSEMISTIDQVTSGTAPDATTLLNMYANENSPFSDPALNASSKDLQSKTYSGLVPSTQTKLKITSMPLHKMLQCIKTQHGHQVNPVL